MKLNPNFLLGLLFLGLPLSAEEDDREVLQETFVKVWEKIDDSFYDRTFNGLDWNAIKKKYQVKVDHIETNEELRAVLNEMLGELGRSHFSITGTRTSSEDRRAKGDYLGIDLRYHDGGLIVYEIVPESPAAEAGMTPGLEIIEVEGESTTDLLKRYQIDEKSGPGRIYETMHEVLQEMAHPEDGKITLKVDRRDSVFDFAPGEYEGEFGKLGQGRPIRMQFDTRLVPGAQKVRIIDFSLFLPTLVGRINQAVHQARSENADGLIIDLRGNLGGLGIMATGLTGRLIDEELDLGDMNNPNGNIAFHAYPQENAYLGPVVVLVDSLSASTSEIFAAALQEHGRARIIGRRTMGAVLPSVIEDLPNGDQFQYAIGDYVTTVKKTHLEGRGVIPDEIVPLDAAALSEGRDPDIEAALRWIKTQSTNNNE